MYELRLKKWIKKCVYKKNKKIQGYIPNTKI